MIQEISKWESKNSGIALLSFTNIAYEEIKKQIEKLSDIAYIQYPHFIGTLDSFISQYLFLPYGGIVIGNHKLRPCIIQEHSDFIDNIVNKTWKRECHQLQCNPFEFYYDENNDFRCIKDNLERCPISKNQPCITLKNTCIRKGYLTNIEMLVIAIMILKKYPSIGKMLAKKFPYIIIDEAQDTSKYQMQVIDLLCSYGVKDIMLIGDPDQAIYEWRNAEPEVFINKYNDANWESKELNENYRCSQKICDATKAFSTLTKPSIAKGYSAECDFIPQVVFYEKDDKQRLIDYFIQECTRRKIEITKDNVAILVRGRTGLLGQDYSQIPNLWQSQVSLLLAQATFEKENGSLHKCLGLVEKALFSLFIDRDKHYNEVRAIYIDKVVSPYIWKRLVVDFCKGLPSASTCLRSWKEEMVNCIEKYSQKYSLQLIAGHQIRIKTRSKNFSDFLDQPINSFFTMKLEESGYLNTTIHAVKGCTFRAVLLILSSRGKLTFKMLNENVVESEEIRTGYVAMTRATEVLMIGVPSANKKVLGSRFKAGWATYEIVD